jgi:hypothetical protein
MYPQQPLQQPPQQQTNPIDYLNSIAPTPKKKIEIKGPMKLIVGAGGALLLVIIISILVSIFSQSDTTQLEQLAARLQATATIASTAQNNIQDSNLQSLNVTLQLYLTNTNRTIVSPLAEQNIDTTNLDPKIIAEENGSAMSAKLEDARLNAVFDNSYADNMSYQLSTIINLMQQIYNTSSNKDLKSFLSTSYTNLTPIQKQFANFNSTDS